MVLDGQRFRMWSHVWWIMISGGQDTTGPIVLETVVIVDKLCEIFNRKVVLILNRTVWS